MVSLDVLVKEFRGAIAHRYTRTDVGAFIESIFGAFAVGPIRRTYRSEVPGIFHRAPTHTAPTFQATFARFSSLSPLAAMRRGTSALRGITKPMNESRKRIVATDGGAPIQRAPRNSNRAHHTIVVNRPSGNRRRCVRYLIA